MYLLQFVAIVSIIVSTVSSQAGDWRYGRGTFYGNEPWYWSIHYGSCGYGYICPEEGTGWDVAAMSDLHYEYSGSCGRCYEVKCNPTFFRDGYGQTLDRTNVCLDAESSVLVTIVDTCPCNYANNAYSNRRWCCGDMDHFDLSVWSFEKLADLKWGVIGLMYRPVPCNYRVANPAAAPAEPHWGEEPEAYGQSCPKYNFPIYSQQTEPEPPALNPQSLVTAFAGPDSYSSYGLQEETEVGPSMSSVFMSEEALLERQVEVQEEEEQVEEEQEEEYQGVAKTVTQSSASILSQALQQDEIVSAAGGETSAAEVTSDPAAIHLESLQQEVQSEDGLVEVVQDNENVDGTKRTTVYGGDGEGTFELSNWNAEVWEMPHVGVHGEIGICGKVYSGGAISLKGDPGSFNGHMIIEFWTRTGGGLANAAINIQGGKRGCTPLMFQRLRPAEVDGDFTRYEVLLEQFVDGEHLADNLFINNQYSPFQGCNGMTVDQIERVSFHNYENHEQFFCIDEVALHSDVSEDD